MTKKSFFKTTKDEGCIILKDKRFSINQSPPSLDLIQKCQKLNYDFRHLNEEVDRAYKIVDTLNKKIDTLLLSDDVAYNEIIEIDKIKQSKKDYVVNIYNELFNLIYDIIEWLLNADAVKIIKKECNNINTTIELFNYLISKSAIKDYAIK